MTHNEKNASGKPVSLVWLRRDLRLYDHAAFAAAFKSGHAVQAVFVFDKAILKRFGNPQDRRISFIAATLCELHAKLKAKGGGLLILYGNAEELIPKLCTVFQSQKLFAAADFEPATRKRDADVKAALEDKTNFMRVKDHLICAPHEVLKDDGTPYRVFTPYSRMWRKRVIELSSVNEQKIDKEEYNDYNLSLKTAREHGLQVLDPEQGAKTMLTAIGYRYQDLPLWPVADAQKLLHEFADERMDAYNLQRDNMGKPATSRLSPYLRFGLISVRECARIAFEHEGQGSTGATTWINELAWREFYAMILYYYPETPAQELQSQYRGLAWSHDARLLEQFTQGQTGYPIIDAAMRELLTTGFMHNRARMIVASFMTKDLLLDWRLGEGHFSQYLMDYELASNVGGWQWAASTGTDAQPYFRVFNPVLQSQRFDPEGHYIRRFVPELAHLSVRDIHEPWKTAKPLDYPAPIVDHSNARAKAIALFKNVSGTHDLKN